MRKLVSILLLFALSFQCFSQLGVLLGYEIHKDYIASVLCINRDKPELHCEGQCYLHKKMQQDEQRKNDNDIVKNNVEVLLFCTTDQKVKTPDLYTAERTFSPLTIENYTSPYFHIFHPPRI